MRVMDSQLRASLRQEAVLEQVSCVASGPGGFTFEVQQLLTEDLCRGFVSETFAWGVVVGQQESVEVVI